MIHSMISRRFWGSLLLTCNAQAASGLTIWDAWLCSIWHESTWNVLLVDLEWFTRYAMGYLEKLEKKVQELSFINTSNKTFQASKLRLVLQSVTPQLHPLACRQACLLATGFWPWPTTFSRSKCCDLTLWDADSPKNFILLTSFEPSWAVKSNNKWKKLLPVKGHGLCPKWTGLRYQLFCLKLIGPNVVPLVLSAHLGFAPWPELTLRKLCKLTSRSIKIKRSPKKVGLYIWVSSINTFNIQSIKLSHCARFLTSFWPTSGTEVTRSEAHRQRDAPHKRQCPLLQGLIEPSCQQFTLTSQRNHHISTQIDCSDCSASVPGTQLDNQPCDAIESQVDTNGADRTRRTTFFRALLNTLDAQVDDSCSTVHYLWSRVVALPQTQLSYHKRLWSETLPMAFYKYLQFTKK